jgi:hypothetical protein
MVEEPGYPAGHGFGLVPSRWKECSRQEAEKTLLAIAEPARREFIPQFLRTLEVGSTESRPTIGLLFRTSSPFRAAQKLSDFQAARSVISPSELGRNLFMKDVTAFEDLISGCGQCCRPLMDCSKPEACSQTDCPPSPSPSPSGRGVKDGRVWRAMKR